jgi:hypothetical protein
VLLQVRSIYKSALAVVAEIIRGITCMDFPFEVFLQGVAERSMNWRGLVLLQIMRI